MLLTHNAAAEPPVSLKRTHMLLAVQSLNVVLVSVNRLGSFTLGYVAVNEFLRWVDLINLLIVPVISVIVSYLIKRDLESDERAQARASGRAWLGALFVLGVYLLGAGYGAHEVTNYLHGRFCLRGDEFPLCGIIAFNDDDFSHWVFFAGFVLMNVALMILQALLPYRGRLTRVDITLLAVNGLFIALGVFANLAFEPIGLDLYVVAVLAFMAAVLLARMRAQPLLIYFAVAFGLGLVATFVYKGFRFA